MPASSLFDQLREQSRPSFEPEPLDTGRIVKDVDTRLAKESADYAKGQEQAAKDAAKQQVQGLREKGYTVVHDEAGNPAPLTATNGEPVRRKAGSRIHVGEQTGTYYEPDLQKGGLKPAVGQKKTDKNGRIIEDFGGGLIKDLGEDPAWAKRKEDKTLLTKAEAAIRDKMLAPPPKGMDVVKTKKDYATAQKALAKAENNLESEPTDKDYLAAHAKAKADLDAIAPQNEAINQWSKSKTGLHRQLAQIKTHRELLGEGAFTDEHRKQWQNVIAPPAAPAPAQVAPATPAPATVTPPAATAGESGQAALQASKEPMSESPTAAPATTGTVASPMPASVASPVAAPVQGQGTVAAPAVQSSVGAPPPQPITPAPREQLVTPESVASLPIADHSSALQASSAALQQNAAALEQKRAQVMAPVAVIDAKLSAWQAKSQAALASGDSAISMMQPDGTMSPLFAASTKKELQDLYLERQKAQTAIAPQLEELDGEFAAHGNDVDAHNQVVESLKGELAAKKDEEEANRASLMKFLRSSPVSSPIVDQLENLKGDFEKSVADIQSKNWDDATKEAAIASLKKANEPKYEEVQRKLESALDPIKRISTEQDLAKESSKLKNEESIAIGKAGSDEEFKALKLKMQQRRSELGARYGVDPEQFDTIADTVKERPYSVENGQLQFLPKYNGEPTPEMLRKGFEAAVKDGVVNDDPTIRESLQKAEEEYSELVKTVGNEGKVKAALVGAGRGFAFMAGAAPGARYGASAGAAIPGLGETGIPEAVGAVIGSLITGTMGAVAYDKIRETAGSYFKAVDSFNKAAELNPGYKSAGELVSFVVMPEGLLKPSTFAKEGLKAGLTPAVAKSVANYAKLADIAADAVGEAGASAAIDSARNVAKLKEVLKASGQSIGGAAAFTAGQYAFDAGRYAIADLVGIKHEELHAPTLSNLATNVGLGLLLHGKSLAFKDYSAPEVASIITRMKVRQDAGISPGEKVEPAVILKAFKDAGVDLDNAGLAEMSRPLTTEEASVYEAAKAQTKKLQESGAFAGKGVEFGGARQAVIPKMFGKSKPVTTAVVRPKGEKPTDTEPQSPNPDVPPNLPGGLPVEVKTAASDAELKVNPNGGDLEKATVLRDIATGANVATMTEGELNAVGLTHKGDKVVPITGKDAPTPAVQVTGDGKAIILQPALDELRATFPATAEFVTMDEKQAREKFAQNGKPDTRPTEPVVENAAPPTVEVAPEPRVEPTPSGEVAAKPVAPNPAAVAKVADIAATLGKQSATKIQEKLSPLHPKVTKVIDGMISAYGQRGVSIVKETTDAPSGIEFDPDSKKIILDLAKIHANTEGSTPDDTIAWVRDSVARHELVHLVSTTDKAVEQHLDNLWSQLSDEDKSASAKTYYKGARSKWDSDFRGKHEFLVQLVQAAEDGKLEPALLKILKGNSKSLFDTLRQLMDALIARLQRILTDPKHKAHEAAKKTLEAFKAARARLFAEPVGKVDTTSGLTDKGETEGDLTTGLARKTTNPAEGGQSKSGVGNRPAASNEAPDASSFASGVASKVADSGDVATVDVKAHEAAASPHNDLTPPTPAQIEADNYKVGKVRLAGEDISIETPAGAKRREEWPALKDHYGRILGTKGADGELLDIFIKEGTPLDWNGPVFVVNQNKPDGTFDETKAIAGAKSVAEAREIYKRNYSKGWKGLGGIVRYDSLKDWVESDHSGKAKVTTGEEETRAKIAELRAESSRLRKEAADYNASTNGRAVANKGRNNIHETNSGSGISTFRAPSLENSESAKHRELINKANEALKKAKKLEATLPKAAPKDVTSVRIQKVVTKRDPGSANIYSVTNLAPDVLKALGFDRVWIIPGQPQQVFADPADGGPRVKLFDGDVSKELIPFLNARLDVKPVNVKTGGMEIIPPPPIPQPTAEVVQPPAPPQLVAETLRASRDTLFDLPPRKRSLSGMRDAVSKRLDELERQEANEEYPKDRMRKGGVQTSGEIVLRDNIDRLRTLLGKIEGAMAPAVANRAIFDKEAKPVVNKPLERAPAVPRPMNMAGETRHVSFKRTNPPQVAQPLVEKGVKITVPYGNGQSVEYSGKAYYLPGYEEYRIVTVPPKGSKSKSTKSWWTAYEQTTGLKIAESREVQGKPSSEQEVLQMALQIMRGKGKAFMDNAIQTTLDKQNESVVKAQETPEKPHISPEIAPVVERPYGPPDETGKSGTETREGKNPNEAKAPELMTPSDFAKTAEFVKAKGTNSGLMVRIGNVMQTFNEQTRGKLTKPAAEILADVHKQIITGKFEMLRSDIADAHPQSVASTAGIARKRLSNPSVYSVSAPAVDAYKLTLPEGYVRDGDVYRYEEPSDEPEKEPWQMTKAEWKKSKSLTFDAGVHQGLVEQALREGKPVPTEVLADYPQLKAPEKAGFGMPPIAVEMLQTAAKAASEFRRRISNVKLAPYVEGQKFEAVTFTLDGKQYRAELKGRNRDLVPGFNPEADKAIASRAFLDGDAVEVPAAEKAPELMTPSEEPPTSNEQPSNPPTSSPTPAEGQSTGGVVEGEKAPTAQEWKALYEEHQALLAASKDNPQAWKPQEWQAHRSALMKREANSRKVPAVWSHNELITATGKYELDHETGELTKLQPLSEIGFLRNVDSLFKDSIPESGIDGGNDLARKLWAKVKAERAEGEQRKADAAAKAQAESKVKAEEQAKLADEQKAKFAEYEASIPKVKFEPATLEVELMGGPTKLNGYRSGDWFIELRPNIGNSKFGPRVWYVPTKQKLPDSLALRNQTEAKDLVTKVVNANKGFSGDFSKDEPQRLRILDTLKAWKDNVAPAWFTTNPATPKETDKPPASSDVVNAPVSTTPSPITNFDSFRAFVTRLQEGKITAEEVRSAWEQFKSAEKDIRVELQKMPKDRLLSMAGISVRASDNKASLASSVFDRLENYFNPTDSLQYGGFGSNMAAERRKALDAKVATWTDDIIRKQAEERRAAIAERDAAKVAADAAKEKAINNPETAAEWDRHVYIKGFRSLTEADKKEILKLKKQRLIDAEVKRRGESLLTPEQLAAYDAVRGFDRKAEAQRQAEAKATVRGVTANTDSEIVETKHTQKGHDLFVVKLADRVERDVYNNLNIAAKRLGGYYSSFRGNGAIPGFQFPTREAAEQFQAVTKGETVDRSEAVQERQADRKNAAAERLNKTADRMDEQADAILNADRKTNTAKRAREAGYAESKANDAKAMAQTMRNLAAAIASGEAVHLDGVTTGTQVETLRSLAKGAKIQSERDEKLSYADIEKRQYEPPTPAQMDAAHYPYPFVNRSDILKLVDLGRNTDGAKLLAERVNKIVLARDGGENGYITDPENLENFRELAKKVSERGKPLWDTYAWKFESYDRLQRMGLKDLPSLRAALREFTQFQNVKSRPDPLKEMGRNLVGMKLPGFFPTPPPVIDRMMDKADLQPGMSVLEPSAGKGDIADRAKATGANVDTVEISSTLRDILKAKGYETLANDIMDVKPEEKQYDRILMNPPFENGQDMEHVMHAYSLLKPGGKLVAVMSEGPFYRNDKKATAFREWLDEHGDSEKLPEGAFAGSDAFRQTGTNTRLVTIEKPAEKLQSSTPNSDEYWSYNTLVKWMTDNGIPVDMTREEYEGEVARRKGIIEPPVHDTTQAGTAQMREQGGYEEYIKNEPRSFREKVWPEALQIVGKEPFKGTELVKELLDSPRALEDTERAILTHESLRRQKAYDKSIDDLIAAKPEDYAAAEKKMMAAREAHQEGLEALDMAGSKAGSALGAIRLMIKNDFSLGRLERRFRAALGPKPTPEEIKEADAKAAELAKVIKENDELTEQIRSQLDEIAGLKAAMKAHEHGLTPKPTKITKKAANDALERLKARRKLGAPGVGSAPMFQATREPFDGTTRVPSYFATSEDYAKNFGEHIRPVAIYPKNTLDLTDIEGSDEEGGKKLKTALQAKGISIDGLNISSDDELPQALMRNLKELSLRIKAAGFDTVRISEYTLNGGADQTVLVVDKSALSESPPLASPSPEDDDFNDLAIFGSSIIEDGASDLASFTTAFNEALPGALGDNASAVYEAAKVKFKEAEAAALKDSTPTGVTNKIKGKRAEITDLKADDLNRLALSIVQHEGVSDVDTLRTRMHDLLKDAFPGVTPMQIGRVWSNVENATYPNPEEIHATVRDLRRQEAQIQKREIVLNENRLPKKSGPQRDAPSDAERELARKLADAIKESGLQVTDPATQLATAQTRATTALKHRRDDLQKQVDAEKRERRSDVTIPETPEMERLRGEIAALNKKLDILDPRNTGPTEAQKIKMAESGLKKSLDNVDKEIVELERKIKTNDLSQPAPVTKTSVTSPTIVQLRKALEAKRDTRDKLLDNLDELREAAKPVVDPVVKMLERFENRRPKPVPRIKSRLEELAKRYLDSENPNFVKDAIGLGMSITEAETAKTILDNERIRREETALSLMKRRVQRSIERQNARAKAFNEDNPIAKKTPAERKLDKDLTEAEFQLSLAKREALRAEEKFRLRNRTPLRKAADFAVKWRRALILADYVVLYKLGMAAGWRMAFTPIEEVIGAGISKAIPGLSKNAPREFGGSVRAEAEALTQGFRYFVENFGKVLKHGVSSMDTKYSSKPDFNDLDPSLSDYIGNSHAAIKLLPKASEFYRSFRKRTEAALRNGIDVTSPAAVQAIAAAAYLDAQRAIFMNPNFVSEGWRAIIGKLRKTETSPNWAKATADVMEAAIPIVKVPTNILFEALGSYIGGILRETPFALKSAAKAATTFDGQGFAKRFNDEYSKLPPEQAEAVLRHLKKGAFGNALMLLVMLTGATAAKLIGGLWTPDDKREPWQVKPERLRLTEDSKDLPRWIAHNPVFDTLHFAVTAYHYAEKAANASKAIAAKAEVEIAEAEHRMKKANGSSKDFIKAQQEREVARKKLEVARSAGDPNKLAWAMATLSGMTTSTLALVEKAPLIGNVGQFLDAIPEDKKGDYLKKELAASAIPTGVTNIAKGEDEGPDGEPIKRKMESFSDHLKNRIPGLRQTLPFKNGETDEFGFKRSETHVPIPGEKAIENFNKKNPDVKYHIPKISQASLDDLRNEVAKTAFQIRAGELLRKYSKEGIVKSEVVNDGSRKEPNFVTKKTVEISPITKEESENPTLKTIEKLKSMHRKAVTTAKSDAERPDWPLSYLDKYRSSVTK